MNKITNLCFYLQEIIKRWSKVLNKLDWSRMNQILSNPWIIMLLITLSVIFIIIIFILMIIICMDYNDFFRHPKEIYNYSILIKVSLKVICWILLFNCYDRVLSLLTRKYGYQASAGMLRTIRDFHPNPFLFHKFRIKCKNFIFGMNLFHRVFRRFEYKFLLFVDKIFFLSSTKFIGVPGYLVKIFNRYSAYSIICSSKYKAIVNICKILVNLPPIIILTIGILEVSFLNQLYYTDMLLPLMLFPLFISICVTEFVSFGHKKMDEAAEKFNYRLNLKDVFDSGLLDHCGNPLNYRDKLLEYLEFSNDSKRNGGRWKDPRSIRTKFKKKHKIERQKRQINYFQYCWSIQEIFYFIYWEIDGYFQNKVIYLIFLEEAIFYILILKVLGS